MNIRFADRVKTLKGTDIRNKLFDNPELITFAAGKPDPALFPTVDLAPLASELLAKQGWDALQYSDTEGFLELREIIAYERMKAAGVDTTPEEITLTSGSQEGIELAAKIFINEGDKIIVESPSYTGSFTAFQIYNPTYISVPMDDEGIIIEELERVLKENPDAKMLYTIPDFQNPTGIQMADNRRKRLCELASEYRLPVIEDAPYTDLFYDGVRHPSLKAFDKDGWVIMLGSFSKTFCPGFRIGWVNARPEICEKFALCKQGTNLQCSTFDELLTIEYMKKYKLDDHIEDIRNLYKKKRDLMLKCVKKFFPAEVKYTTPHGGFFLWLKLKKDINTKELLIEAAKDYKVAFIPGSGFFAEPGYDNFIRLSFSFVSLEEIEEGMKRLGSCISAHY